MTKRGKDSREKSSQSRGRDWEGLFHDATRVARSKMGGAARRVCEPEDIAQQVVSELLAHVAGAIADADGKSLAAMARRRAVHRVMDAGRSARPLREIEDAPAKSASTGPVTRGDELRRVREIGESLPRIYAEVVRGLALGRTVHELAEAADVPLDTMKKRVRKTIQLVRMAWTQRT